MEHNSALKKQGSTVTGYNMAEPQKNKMLCERSQIKKGHIVHDSVYMKYQK